MKWSWKIGRVKGIELRIHATFVLLLAWIALANYRESQSAAGALAGVAFTLALFASVVLHEFGHALVAQRFGVPTRDVTLLPIGGVARMEFIPDKPKQELWIALAGPAVTAAIIAVLFLALWLTGAPTTLPQRIAGGPLTTTAFATQLMWVNVSLLVFNLLPAFPMDGGRVLRAVLAFRMNYIRATDIAARIGRGFAVFFGVVGLLFDPILVLIALFVWLGAAGEAAESQLRSMLSGVPVDRVMVRDYDTLAPDDTLAAAQSRVLAGFQQDFPVLDGQRVVGVLTRAALVNGLKHHAVNSPVKESMERSFRTVDPSDAADKAVAQLGESRAHTMPVVRDGRLLGLLTLENIAEYVMMETALRRPAKAGA